MARLRSQAMAVLANRAHLQAAAATDVVRLALDDPAWHAFVSSDPGAVPYHHPAWAGLLAECYGYAAFALTTRDGSGELAAGIPVIEVRRPLGPRRWISLPFTDALPVLGRGEREHTLLADGLRAAAARDGVEAFELRTDLRGAHRRQAAVVHALELDEDPGAVSRRFGSSVRRNISRAAKLGVVVRRAERVEDVTSVFFGLHVRTRRRLGVPVQPQRYFELLWRRLAEIGLAYALIAEADGRPVAAAIFLDWNGVVTYKYGASDESAWPLRPNNLLFWTAIREACEAGRHTFDFGRTDLDNAGLRAFKSSWGAREAPLVYSTLGGKTVAAGGARPGSLAAGFIRRSPMFVCRVTGALLYRYAA